LIVTDSIPLREDVSTDKITVLPVHDMFAQVLQCLMSDKSISTLFTI
jgi:phosphoribosylpyrophosphate synthetase